MSENYLLQVSRKSLPHFKYPWKLPVSHRKLLYVKSSAAYLATILYIMCRMFYACIHQCQAKPQVNCWPYRCKLNSSVYMQWCKKHLHNVLSIRRAVYIDSCQQMTRAKTIPTFHMLVHSNILPSFQIDVNKSTQTHTRHGGMSVCYIFRVQPNDMPPI